MAPSPVTEVLLILDQAEVALGPGEHCVGRNVECELRIDDPLASRRHATVVVRPGGVSVRDLGSRNGVVVNGEDVDGERALLEGDVVTIGSKVITVLRVCHADDPAKAAAPAAPRPAESVTLARILVTRRAVPRSELPEADAAAATISREVPPDRSSTARPPPEADAFRLLAAASARCIASGREERVALILEAPLAEVAATLRSGLPIEDEILAIVVEQALLLCEITHAQRWIDYLHDHFDLIHRPIPLDVVDRLMAVVDHER